MGSFFFFKFKILLNILLIFLKIGNRTFFFFFFDNYMLDNKLKLMFNNFLNEFLLKNQQCIVFSIFIKKYLE